MRPRTELALVNRCVHSTRSVPVISYSSIDRFLRCPLVNRCVHATRSVPVISYSSIDRFLRCPTGVPKVAFATRAASIFPCGYCEEPVTSYCDDGVACDNCDVWYHTSCISMCSSDYALLQRSNVQWICPKCDSINCDSFTFHSYELSCSNYYNPLSEDNTTIDSISSHPLVFSPLRASSPRDSSPRSPQTRSYRRNKTTSKNTSNPQPPHTPPSSDSSHPQQHPPPPPPPPQIQHATSTSTGHSHHTPAADKPRSDSSNVYGLPKKSNLRILTLNCQRILGKTAELAAALKYLKPDIVCGTESWLYGIKPGANPSPDHVKSSEVFPEEYNVFRKDRNCLGGGIFILIHKSLTAVEQPELSTDCEILWAKLKLQNRKDLNVGCFYMPHRNKHDMEQLDKSLNLLTQNGKKDCPIVLAGDFNCPHINWINHTTHSTGKDNDIQQSLVDIMQSSTLTQVHHSPTRFMNILDLIFFSNPSLVKSSVSVPGISDHEMIVTDADTRPQRTTPLAKKCFQFHKAEWSSLRTDCDSIAESVKKQADSGSTMEDLWSTFKSSLLSAIDTHIPHKMKTRRPCLPWINTSLKRMLRKKKRLLTRARKTNNWTTYKFHQKECRRQMRKAERNHINTTIEEGLKSNNSKPFWQYIKARKQDSTGVAPLKEKGQLYSDSKSKARILLQQFKSVFTRDTDAPLPSVKKTCAHDIPRIHIHPEGVLKLLRNINPNKAPGPDKIPNLVLKECAPNLAPALTTLFQYSLDTGDLPSDWRNANIACVYKKGDKHAAENYRPISLTSVISKLLEHIICRHILTHLEKHDILTNLNHGFRSGYSCDTQLLLTSHDLLQSYDRQRQVDVAILDFSKAFDTVPHKRLLHKLNSYGIRGSLHTWITNFLVHRKMSVVIEGDSSEETTVDSGVPQGTCLGPLLFLCHINDLPDTVKSQVRLFADDCLLYCEINSFQDHLQLQNDLCQLETWASDWGMNFNPKKCFILGIQQSSNFIYTLCNTPLQHVSSNLYLGILFSNDLKWSTHIASTTKKASSTLGFLRRNLHFFPQHCKKNAYLALIRPLLEYGCITWSPYLQQDINRLERIQRLSARFITNDYSTRSPGAITNMLSTLKLPTLQQRRRDLRLTFFYKVVEGLVPAIPSADILTPSKTGRRIIPRDFKDYASSSAISDHIRNNSRSFQVSRCQTDQFRNSYFVNTVREWNHLDEATVTTSSVESFKARLSDRSI
ncbi:hypothetical protein ACOMHN_003416 [Nucella lapillus]